ncbi:hypothetical protein VTJ49DRAFT_7731 [Mycothermus thermophilus]|uniref:SET domain-containing protein n=1 Tax=Humicola insolens TaxID=85995 RepID=A0ABR3VH76_HUMIN
MPKTRATKKFLSPPSSSGSPPASDKFDASDKFEAFDWTGQNRFIVPGVTRIQTYRVDPSRWTHLTSKPSSSLPVSHSSGSDESSSSSSSSDNDAMDIDSPTRMTTRSMTHNGGAHTRTNVKGGKRSAPPPPTNPRPTKRQRTAASDETPSDSSDILPPEALPIMQLPRNLKGADVFCLNCGRTPSSGKCNINCYREFRNTHFVPAESKIHIRRTAPGTHYTGLGVYVNSDSTGFREGDYLGEYLGVILPPGAHETLESDYVFTLDGVIRQKGDEGGRRVTRSSHHEVAPEVYIDAAKYGNWTRFVNSACSPNVEALTEQAGRVRMVVYRAVRAIRPGEQLFVYYGKGYFTARRLKCLCPDDSEPHTPPEDTIYVGGKYSNVDDQIASTMQELRPALERLKRQEKQERERRERRMRRHRRK